ncbi:MAG: MFS transporter [Betaproteobacteria bacterium]|nr:MFS transporter [Betaproteobacteria bacterium]
MTLSRTTRVNGLIGTGHFLAHFYVLCLPPLFLVWQAAFHVSFAALGLVLALMSATTAILQTPVGFLVDRHGARYYLVGGAALMSLGIAAMGFVTSFWELLVCAVVSGVGNSVIHPADYTILSGSVEKDRIGRSFALHTFAGNVGFSAAPPIMALLLLAIGWRASLATVGLVGVATAGAMLAQSGILEAEAPPPMRDGSPAVASGRLLVSGPILLFFGFYLLGAMSNSGIQAWLITVLHRVGGVSLTAASATLTAYTVGATAGVLLGGFVADAFKRHVLGFAVAVTIVSASLLLAVNALPLPVVAIAGLMLASGLAVGASRAPRDVMLKSAAPAGQVGKVFGFVSAGLPLGSALTPVPFGFLIDRGHPELLLALAAGLLLASLVFVAAAVAWRRAPLAARAG